MPTTATTTPCTTYTRTAIALHWLMAVLIVSAVALGWYMADLKLTPTRVRLFNYHKWLGITILLIAAARLLWRLFHKPPPIPADFPRWQHVAAHGAHWALYVLFFLTPLAGWIYSSAAGFPVVWFGVVPLPDLVAPDKHFAEVMEQRHAFLAYTLTVVVLVHVAAAIKHGLDRPTDYMQRMTSLER